MKKGLKTRISWMVTALLTLGLTLSAGIAYADDSDLDVAINSGFGKLVKYGRWAAALALAVFFVLGAAERGQNQDNPHEQQRATKKMIWTGAGFLLVIGYKLILSGLVAWFNIDPAAIPSFLWQ